MASSVATPRTARRNDLEPDAPLARAGGFLLCAGITPGPRSASTPESRQEPDAVALPVRICAGRPEPIGAKGCLYRDHHRQGARSWDCDVSVAGRQYGNASDPRSVCTRNAALYGTGTDLGNRDQIAPQTDMWALAMIAYDMLVECYWQVPNLAQLVSRIALLKQPAPSSQTPSLPKTFDLWFAKACAYEAGDRFQSVTEQVDALAYALQVDPVWLDATVPPDTLLARFNESSPPKQESVRSRSHSALTTARARPRAWSRDHRFVPPMLRVRAGQAAVALASAAAAAACRERTVVSRRGQRHVETTAENVEPKSAGRPVLLKRKKLRQRSEQRGTSSDSKRRKKKGRRFRSQERTACRMRSRTDGSPAAPAAKHRKTEYDPVAP